MSRAFGHRPGPDLSVTLEGSVALIRPESDAGSDWIADNLQVEPWQFFGKAVACEPRYIADIVLGASKDGLGVKTP
jgi:hypothetical protein